MTSQVVVLLQFILCLQGITFVKDLESILLQGLTIHPFHLNDLSAPLLSIKWTCRIVLFSLHHVIIAQILPLYPTQTFRHWYTQCLWG